MHVHVSTNKRQGSRMVVSIINTGDDLIKIKEREATAWMDGHARSLVNHACEIALLWTDLRGCFIFKDSVERKLEYSMYLSISLFRYFFFSKFGIA